MAEGAEEAVEGVCVFCHRCCLLLEGRDGEKGNRKMKKAKERADEKAKKGAVLAAVRVTGREGVR